MGKLNVIISGVHILFITVWISLWDNTRLSKYIMSLILISTEVKDGEDIQVSGVLIFRSFLGA